MMIDIYIYVYVQNILCVDCWKNETALLKELLDRGFDTRDCVPRVRIYIVIYNLLSKFDTRRALRAFGNG